MLSQQLSSLQTAAAAESLHLGPEAGRPGPGKPLRSAAGPHRAPAGTERRRGSNLRPPGVRQVRSVRRVPQRLTNKVYSKTTICLRYLQGRPEEAASLLSQSEQKTRECYGEESERRLVVTYGDVAWLKYHTGDVTLSQSYCQRVHDVLVRTNSSAPHSRVSRPSLCPQSKCLTSVLLSTVQVSHRVLHCPPPRGARRKSLDLPQVFEIVLPQSHREFP